MLYRTKAVLLAAATITSLVVPCRRLEASPPRDGAESAQQINASQRRDSVAVALVVERFHRALRQSDSTAALAMLAPDVVILESGSMETRDEYRRHHLPADIAFASALPGVRAPLKIFINGNSAWAVGTSVTQGEFKGRAINSGGAELIVLSRGKSGWQIRAIHWSSRTRRPPA